MGLSSNEQMAEVQSDNEQVVQTVYSDSEQMVQSRGMSIGSRVYSR